MILRPKARELIAGIADDATFGPIVVFGHGGTAVEIVNDKALALPPIDLKLARDLISRTRVARMLKAYRNVPAADEDAIALLLVQSGSDWRPTCRKSARSISIRSSPTRAASSSSTHGSRWRRCRATRHRAARPSALCHPALSDGMGAPCRAARRGERVRAAGQAGGRAAVPGLLPAGDRRGSCGCASSPRSRTSATPSSRA